MNDCAHCGFPLHVGNGDECAKCGEPTTFRRSATQGLLEVDVAHAGESWEQAKRMIDRALDDAERHGHSGIKIIHGYGSSSGTSIIAPQARSYMRHLADQVGGRFTPDRKTLGSSLLWLNR